MATNNSPLLFNASHIDTCYAYRGKADDESYFDWQRMANELEGKFYGWDRQSHGLSGRTSHRATLGAVAAEDGCFTRIREICDQYGVLLILDEVMCGMGELGLCLLVITIQYDQYYYYYQGLGAGYQPIGATLCSKIFLMLSKRGAAFST